MEQLQVLISQLKEQYERHADPAQLLLTVRLLEAELTVMSGQVSVNRGSAKVAVMMPSSVKMYAAQPAAAPAAAPAPAAAAPSAPAPQPQYQPAPQPQYQQAPQPPAQPVAAPAAPAQVAAQASIPAASPAPANVQVSTVPGIRNIPYSSIAPSPARVADIDRPSYNGNGNGAYNNNNGYQAKPGPVQYTSSSPAASQGPAHNGNTPANSGIPGIPANGNTGLNGNSATNGSPGNSGTNGSGNTGLNGSSTSGLNGNGAMSPDHAYSNGNAPDAQNENSAAGDNAPGSQLSYDPLTELPTLAHQQQREINDLMGTNGASLNDRLKNDVMELAATLNEAPVRDLKKAIGINDRFVFISQLFRGDEVMYERSIKTINGFRILPEAEYWMERELKVKLGWDENREATRQFYQLVRRRFS